MTILKTRPSFFKPTCPGATHRVGAGVLDRGFFLTTRHGSEGRNPSKTPFSGLDTTKPDRLFRIPDRLLALPDRLFLAPDRVLGTAVRLFLAPDQVLQTPRRVKTKLRPVP